MRTMSYKSDFIEFMVRAGVLTFGDFTLKSGRKAPYFVNTGNYKSGSRIDKLGYFYAACIMENIKAGKITENIDALFGPAYKGIPLSVAAAISLSRDFGKEVNFCFNRKEAKGHGEGGLIVGHSLSDGDSVVIIEDVITAGTAVREILPVLKSQADVKIAGLVISVDRMERGKSDKTAVSEIKEEFGIDTFPIVTVRDIIDELYNTEVDGKIVITEDIKEKIEEYIKTYC